MANYTVLLDACIMYPAPLRCYLMYLAQWSPLGKVLETYAHKALGGYGVFKLEIMTANPSSCSSSR